MKIEIVSTGAATTIQDLGRYGYRAFGVPVSGAMDKESFQLANLLLGNDLNAPCLEMTLIGGVFKFFEDTKVAITGANMKPSMSNGHPVPMWQTVVIPAGETLCFQIAETGMRTYIAFEGGVDVDLVMGSASTYKRAEIYPLFGRPLEKGDVFQCKGTNLGQHLRVPIVFRPSYPSKMKIRVIMGPHEEAFTDEGISTFLTSTYLVTKESDRMGMRLTGAVIEHKDKADILSDGIVPGAIQVPQSGEPIILLSDAQTTGGYTKIAHVITMDLNRLAQARPGDEICFERCSLEQAQQVLKEQKSQLEAMVIPYDASSLKHFCVSVNGRGYNLAVEEVLNEQTENNSSKVK